jgi:hypothetical protein
MSWCLHSHLNPIVFPLRFISVYFIALHRDICLWNFHSISTSSGESATEPFADRRSHAVAKPRLIQIAGIRAPELSSVSRICVNIAFCPVPIMVTTGYTFKFE